MIVEGPAWAEVLAGLHGQACPAAERWDRQAMAALLAMPGCFACLGDDAAGAVCGMALLRVVADEVELLSIVVLPPARGRGAGAALLAAALREAAVRGAARAFLEVSTGNAPANALYRRHGFSEVGIRARYYADGSDARVLRCGLSPVPCG